MKIVRIKAKDIKGIDEVDIACEIFPNAPNFLVAPNGTGKSSLAKAFKSLNRSRLRLNEVDFRRGKDDSESRIEVVFDNGESLSADCRSNSFAGALDISVIDSGLYARQVMRSYGGRSYAEASVSASDVVLWERIPPRAKIDYSVAQVKRGYPSSLRKGILDLKPYLDKPVFLDNLVKLSLTSISGAGYSRRVESFIGSLEAQSAAGVALGDLAMCDAGIRNVLPVVKATELLRSYAPVTNEALLFLNAIQVCRLYESQKANVKACEKYLSYNAGKKEIGELLDSVNTTGRTVSLRKDGQRLLLRLPDRSQLSNGELDILHFVASLAHARANLTAGRSLLIIDEVFDYLDDGNLLIAQHFLLEMIERSKREGRELYVLMLTHLDPNLMESYRFKTNHVSYFTSVQKGTLKGYTKKLVGDRGRCKEKSPGLYQDLSARYLHYSCDSSSSGETEAYLSGKGFPENMRSVEGFRVACVKQMASYLKGSSYDTVMVCCALRVHVERLACEQLAEGDAKLFLETHATVEKLKLAEEKGAQVPELHYLLSGLYNPALHFDERLGQAEMLRQKLDNVIIKRMVQVAWDS